MHNCFDPKMGNLLLSGTSSIADQSEMYSALGLDQEDEASSSSGKRVSGTPPVVSFLASLLEKTIQRNEKLLNAGSRRKGVMMVTVFHGSRAPSLSIKQYIERIFKYAKCSNSCFVVGYIYTERFLQKTSGSSDEAFLSSLNAHRLLITSIMIAAKFLDDNCYDNAYYAKIGGTSTAEMNRMEIKFLFDLDFNLHVSTELFWDYCLKLRKESPEQHKMDQSITVWPPRRLAKQRWQKTASSRCMRDASIE